MKISVREYEEKDLEEMILIWNATISADADISATPATQSAETAGDFISGRSL